jgi:hypothetical protein
VILEFARLDLIDDHEASSNTHTPEQIHKIKAMMLRVGITSPALVRRVGERYGLITTQGRCEAARQLYAEERTLSMPDGTPIPVGKYPVLFADGLSAEQVHAYVRRDRERTKISGL